MIPDFTPINPTEVLELNMTYVSWGNILYYSYEELYEFWLMSERDDTLIEKIADPKIPTDPALTMTDFMALGHSLAVYGYIG